MSADPTLLLDTSIAHLQTLAAFFADEIGNCRALSPAPTPETRACKEALLTISVLIPKLQAARYVVMDGGPLGQRCASCDD